MVHKNSTSKVKLASVGKAVSKKKRTRNVNAWKKPGTSKSIVTKVNATLQKDLLTCINHYNIQAPTDIFRMLVKKEADAIRALKGLSAEAAVSNTA